MSLSGVVSALAGEHAVPGVAVGVWADGRAHFACHGVTSLEDPRPVDEDTLFVVGSVAKTFTASALMCLVADGRVELDAPVQRYLPQLRLADPGHAARITVGQLLNHTAGLGHGLVFDSGDGEDALARYVAELPGLDLVGEPGARASYSQAGFNVAGRIIEKVTGRPFERAVADLLLEPLGLRHTAYLPEDVAEHSYATGHNADEDGTPVVARLRKRWRGDNPGGGLEASVADLVAWARFHLGPAHGIGGPLSGADLERMRTQTTELRGSTLGDGIGIAWFLREVGGVRAAGHGGSTNGQFAELLLVPERNFAVVSLANGGPGGIPFNQAVVRWALERYLGVLDADPAPLPYDPRLAPELAGVYDTDAMTIVIADEGDRLTLAAGIKPEIRAAAEAELPPDYPAAEMGLLGGDEYIVTDGGLRGQRGFFTRGADGAIVGVDLAGRVFARVR